MNTLVVYDSQYGNTEKIALQIAKTLNEFGAARATRVTAFTPDALNGVELLVIGCPTQAWHSTQVTQSFIAGLERERLSNLLIAAFDTRVNKPRLITGSAANSIAKQLRRLGATTLLPPECFLVTGTEGPLAAGELERAAEWARQLHDEFEVEAEPLTVPM